MGELWSGSGSAYVTDGLWKAVGCRGQHCGWMEAKGRTSFAACGVGICGHGHDTFVAENVYLRRPFVSEGFACLCVNAWEEMGLDLERDST